MSKISKTLLFFILIIQVIIATTIPQFSTKCAENARFFGISRCICEKGYYSSEANDETKKCIKCDDKLTTLQVGKQLKSDCDQCIDKMRTLVNNECICKQGTYINGDNCTQCENNTWSKDGSTKSSDCTTCKGGYYYVEDTTAVNKFKCIQCSDGLTSNNGNTQGSNSCFCEDLNAQFISDNNKTCKCKDGYLGDATKIDPCTKIQLILVLNWIFFIYFILLF